jgi:SulP family sulfate permease
MVTGHSDPASRWVSTLFPGLTDSLRPWDRRNLVAGVTVLVYLVPQVMAYATVAGVSPVTGLWACLPALVVYAFMGTSRLLSMGPESSVALMSAAVVAPLVATNPEQYPVLVAGLAVAVGAVCLVAGLARLGFIANLLSRPILVGYMTGIAILMIDGQLEKLLGNNTEADSVPAHFWQAAVGLGGADPVVVGLSFGILFLLFALQRWYPKLPGPLIAMIVATAVASALISRGFEVPVVGEVPRGLPPVSFPALAPEQWEAIILGAIGVSIVAFADLTLTARAFKEPDDPSIQVGAELRALGVSNLGAGVLSGMPVSSSGSRTAVAQTSRAHSQGYSLVVAAGLVGVLLFFGPVLSILPQPGLAALVVYAAVRLIDIAEYKLLWRFRRSEFLLAILTVAGVLIAGVLYGVVIAVALSALDMLARVARPHGAALGLVPDLPGMHDVGDFDAAEEVDGLLIYRFDSPLFFANAETFLQEARLLIDAREPGLEWFALNCEAIVEVDSTGVDALQRLHRTLTEHDVRFVLVRAKRELVEDLRPTELIDMFGDEHIYPTLPTLVEAFRASQDPGQVP